MKLDRIWAEFEELGDAKAEATRRASLSLGIKESLPQIFVQLTTQPGMTYEELKSAIKASSSYLTSELERRQEAMAFQATDSHRSASKLDSNQCAYY